MCQSDLSHPPAWKSIASSKVTNGNIIMSVFFRHPCMRRHRRRNIWFCPVWNAWVNCEMGSHHCRSVGEKTNSLSATIPPFAKWWLLRAVERCKHEMGGDWGIQVRRCCPICQQDRPLLEGRWKLGRKSTFLDAEKFHLALQMMPWYPLSTSYPWEYLALGLLDVWTFQRCTRGRSALVRRQFPPRTAFWRRSRTVSDSERTGRFFEICRPCGWNTVLVWRLLKHTGGDADAVQHAEKEKHCDWPISTPSFVHGRVLWSDYCSVSDFFLFPKMREESANYGPVGRHLGPDVNSLAFSSAFTATGCLLPDFANCVVISGGKCIFCAFLQRSAFGMAEVLTDVITVTVWKAHDCTRRTVTLCLVRKWPDLPSVHGGRGIYREITNDTRRDCECACFLPKFLLQVIARKTQGLFRRRESTGSGNSYRILFSWDSSEMDPEFGFATMASVQKGCSQASWCRKGGLASQEFAWRAEGKYVALWFIWFQTMLVPGLSVWPRPVYCSMILKHMH